MTQIRLKHVIGNPENTNANLPNDYETATDIKDHDIDTNFLKLTFSGC